MTPFDYVMVLVSIVIGLGMTTVLSNLATLMHARQRVVLYWPAIAWAIWVLFVDVQHWWALWGAHSATHWNLGGFVLTLLVPIELFLLAALVLPPRDEGETIDLGAWFFQNRMWFYAVLVCVPLSSLAEELARAGRIESRANLWFQVFFFLSAALGLPIASRRGQAWLTALAMTTTVAYSALLFSRLPG